MGILQLEIPLDHLTNFGSTVNGTVQITNPLIWIWILRISNPMNPFSKRIHQIKNPDLDLPKGTRNPFLDLKSVFGFTERNTPLISCRLLHVPFLRFQQIIFYCLHLYYLIVTLTRCSPYQCDRYNVHGNCQSCPFFNHKR